MTNRCNGQELSAVSCQPTFIVPPHSANWHLVILLNLGHCSHFSPFYYDEIRLNISRCRHKYLLAPLKPHPLAPSPSMAREKVTKRGCAPLTQALLKTDGAGELQTRPYNLDGFLFSRERQ